MLGDSVFSILQLFFLCFCILKFLFFIIFFGANFLNLFLKRFYQSGNETFTNGIDNLFFTLEGMFEIWFRIKISTNGINVILNTSYYTSMRQQITSNL